MAHQEEQWVRLRDAQNANRGHPRKGEWRHPLKQINVKCRAELSDRFTALSLQTGKTKRTLLEEALTGLFERYTHGLRIGEREETEQAPFFSRPPGVVSD